MLAWKYFSHWAISTALTKILFQTIDICYFITKQTYWFNYIKSWHVILRYDVLNGSRKGQGRFEARSVVEWGRARARHCGIVPVISALRRRRQEDQEFEVVILVTWDLISSTLTQGRERGTRFQKSTNGAVSENLVFVCDLNNRSALVSWFWTPQFQDQDFSRPAFFSNLREEYVLFLPAGSWESVGKSSVFLAW